MRRWIAIAVAAPWVAWAVGRTFGLDRVHPLVAIVAFTPYAAITAPIAIVVALALRRWLAALVALVAGVLLAVAVVPRGLGSAEPPAGDEPDLTVMTSNLYGGRADPERVVDLVRRNRVDVLFLQELTPRSLARLDRAGLRSLLRYRSVEPQVGGGGNGILSRRPVRRAQPWERPREPAVDVDEPSFGMPVRVRVVHPFPPLRRGSAHNWRGELLDLPSAPGGPAVIAGDFNATLDHQAFRSVLDRGWQDAAAEVGEGLRATWPVRRRVLGLAIDHVLVSPALRVRAVSINEIEGTDHRAVIARLDQASS